MYIYTCYTLNRRIPCTKWNNLVSGSCTRNSLSDEEKPFRGISCWVEKAYPFKGVQKAFKTRSRAVRTCKKDQTSQKFGLWRRKAVHDEEKACGRRKTVQNQQNLGIWTCSYFSLVLGLPGISKWLQMHTISSVVGCFHLSLVTCPVLRIGLALRWKMQPSITIGILHILLLYLFSNLDIQIPAVTCARPENQASSSDILQHTFDNMNCWPRSRLQPPDARGFAYHKQCPYLDLPVLQSSCEDLGKWAKIQSCLSWRWKSLEIPILKDFEEMAGKGIKTTQDYKLNHCNSTLELWIFPYRRRGVQKLETTDPISRGRQGHYIHRQFMRLREQSSQSAGRYDVTLQRFSIQLSANLTQFSGTGTVNVTACCTITY